MPSPSTYNGTSLSIAAGYRYVVEIQLKDRRISAPLASIDWVPAVEWWHWCRIREGSEAATMPPPPAVVEPIWDPQLGVPYVAGVRLSVQNSPGFEKTTTVQTGDIPTTFFYPAIQQSVTPLTMNEIEQLRVAGKLKITAHALERIPEAPTGRFFVQELSQPLSLQETSMQFFEDQMGKTDGHSSWLGGIPDFPVYIRSSVIQEVIEQAREAEESEAGGILIGLLHKDQKSTQIFAEITGYIPARHVQSGRYSLEFTPDTWSAVHEAISLRKTLEIPLGWGHSHPYFCLRCTPEQRMKCSFKNPFFSQTDMVMHREIFPRAFNVALLITNRGPGGFAVNMYGWRYGMIKERSFFTINRSTF